MNNITIFKCISIVSIWFVGFIGGILPYFIHKTNKRLMILLNCFSGGIFLSGGFIHLLHSAITNKGLYHWSEINNKKYNFPYPEMFITIGFLAIFFIEQIAHSLYDTFDNKNNIKNNKKQSIRFENKEYEHVNRNDNEDKDNNKDEELINNKLPLSLVTTSECREIENDKRLGSETISKHLLMKEMKYNKIKNIGTLKSNIIHRKKVNINNMVQYKIDNTLEDQDHYNKIHDHNHFIINNNTSSSALTFVLFIALSFHSILEGLGIGAQKQSAWGIFIAIIVHKSLAAFALGTGLLRSNIKKLQFFIYMFTFSMMSIIGILISWLLVLNEKLINNYIQQEEDTENSAIAGICISLASGTFIYVALMEIIPKEFNHSNTLYTSKLEKCVALLVGYIIFGILAIWT